MNVSYYRFGIGNVVFKLQAGFCISDRSVAADTEPPADIEAFKGPGFMWRLVIYRTGTIGRSLIRRCDLLCS